MVLGSILQLTVNELGGTVVYDSEEDMVGPPIVDRYKEGYKEAMRDVWRWLDRSPPFSAPFVNADSLRDYIQSQIKQAEGVSHGK